MADPFANLKTLDAAGDVTDVDAFDEALADPFDDVPEFDPAEAPEVDATAGANLSHVQRRTPTRRLFFDYRADPQAMTHLKTLPAEGESLHAVMSQRYSLWDLVPALLERTGRRIDELHVATLSYSAKTAADLIGLLDDGRIRRVTLLVSYYLIEPCIENVTSASQFGPGNGPVHVPHVAFAMHGSIGRRTRACTTPSCRRCASAVTACCRSGITPRCCS